MPHAGLYIVTLNNEQPISVNANDPRIAQRCIKVARGHCKFGKARDLAARERGYGKVFGPENVNFRPIAHTDDIAAAERCVLAQLRHWRVRGLTGHLNEWLLDIPPGQVEDIAVRALSEAGIVFVRT